LKAGVLVPGRGVASASPATANSIIASAAAAGAVVKRPTALVERPERKRYE
jgi:hypothetical protein